MLRPYRKYLRAGSILAAIMPSHSCRSYLKALDLPPDQLPRRSNRVTWRTRAIPVRIRWGLCVTNTSDRRRTAHSSQESSLCPFASNTCFSRPQLGCRLRRCLTDLKCLRPDLCFAYSGAVSLSMSDSLLSTKFALVPI